MVQTRLSSTRIALFTLFACLAFSAFAGVHGSDESSSSSVYSIDGQIRLPKPSKFINARVLLNGGESSAVVRADGSFQIFSVIAGKSYTLDVVMPEYSFSQIRVDVSNKTGQKGKIKASQGQSNQKIPYPLVIRPNVKTEYFQKREPVNWFGMLKNPMVIMMGITLIMVVVMPRMMSSMDPAELEEMKKMQAKMSIDGWRKTLEQKANEIKEAGK